MRQKNPAYMEEIISVVDQFYGEHGRTPSCSEIAERSTLKRSAVHNYLVAMNEQGKIEYNGQTILTPSIRAQRDGFQQVGIVGSIACGLPMQEEQQMEGYMNLPVTMTGYGETYILYAHGNSMINAGIDDGDMVLVKRQEEARNGDIVVSYVEGEGNTLKRLLHEGNQIYLHPENDTMEDIPITECKIQGVALWVFKKVG